MSASFPIAIDPPAFAAAPVFSEQETGATEERLRDGFGRAITDLRLSVTDRCNYRCVYCRTGTEGVQYAELANEEYLRIARLFVELGVEKIRLTGGEPLLRPGLLDLVRELAALRTVYLPDGSRATEGEGLPLDLALTTNGHLLAETAHGLRDAGLTRVTVSMDAVDPETFAAITRVPRSFDRVLAGVRAAKAAGLEPVKVNCVLLRGVNDDQIEAFAEFSRREGVVVRFIEWMPLEERAEGPQAQAWAPETVVRMDEIVARLERVHALEELPATVAGETARRFGFRDGMGEIGIIAPVSRPFCGHCSRVRLTSDGKIRTCLFSQTEYDLAGKMHRDATDVQLMSYIQHVVMRKELRHHIGEPGFSKPSRSMVHIGG